MIDERSAQIDPAVLVTEAEKLYHQGKCDNAIDLLVAAGEQMPESHQIQVKLADLLIDSEQYADALTILDNVPDKGIDTQLVARKGYCQAGMGDYRTATQSVDDVLANEPNNPAALHLSGLIAFQTDLQERAEHFFRKALTLDPDYGQAYTDLGLAIKKGGDPAAALNLLENGFKCAPTTRNVVLAYHNELLAQSEFDRAENTFRAAVERHPGNQRLKFIYIDILLRLGKIQAALDMIQDCLVRFGAEEGLIEAALQVRCQLDESALHKDRICEPRISLCMIVKNEEMHLARCLASVQPLVDEIVIIDTGSTDLTEKIGGVFGAKISTCQWQNDFALARNLSLSKATGNWVLILDADEVISRQDHDRLRSLINNTTDGACAYSIVTRNYTHQANLVGWTANQGDYPSEEVGSGWYPSPKVRLFPNDSHIRFRYPIHELVEPSLQQLGIKIESCPIPVHHFGKLNGQINDQKARDYYALGIRKLESLGDNAVALREMAVQAAGLDKYDEAADLWHRYLKLVPDCAEAYVNMGTACWNMADYKRAARFAEKAIALAPEFKEAQFNAALAHLYLGGCQKAIAILEALLARQPHYLAARFMLASAHACGGFGDKARQGFNPIRKSLSDPEYFTAVAEVAERLESAGLNRMAENMNRFAQ